MDIKVKIFPCKDSWNTNPPPINVDVDNARKTVCLETDDYRKIEIDQKDLQRIIKLLDI